MPRIVDHDAKRREVIALARELIKRDGLEALSIRKLAEAAGSSTAIISHYFSGKNELLLHIYRENLAAARRRRKAVKRGGLEGLIGLCDEFLPLTPEWREGWKISVVFTSMACSVDDFAEEYRENVILAREQLRIRLEDAVRGDPSGPAIDCDMAARRLLAVIQGVGIEAAIDETDWPPARQREVIRREIMSLIGKHGDEVQAA